MTKPARPSRASYGRNRHKACALAGIEPRFEKLPEGTDIKAYIVSTNLKHRFLNKGQQAVALAMIYPDPTPGKRTDLLRDATGSEVEKSRLSRARRILRAAPDLAARVLADGTYSLDKALAEIARQQDDADNHTMRLGNLRETHPDLADAVEEEHITLDEAETQVQQEAEELKLKQRGFTRMVLDSLTMLSREPVYAKDCLEKGYFDPGIVQQAGREPITKEHIDRAIEYLTVLRDNWEHGEKTPRLRIVRPGG